MIKEAKRYFNTSGPNRAEEHYTLKREQLLKVGINLVQKERYFTIRAPRQTGKSTFITFLVEKLNASGYKTAYINVENFGEEPLHVFMNHLLGVLNEGWATTFKSETFGMLYDDIFKTPGENKSILIIDECIYLVFVSNVYKELDLKDEILEIGGVTIRCYVIFFDEAKDF